jgi:polysaccharide export outer membrane protein
MKIKSIARHLAHWPITFSILAAAFLILLTGCQTSKNHPNPNASAATPVAHDAVLREADVLKIVFPGSDNLNTVVTIRRDGKITLPIVGEWVAAGKTPADLRRELVERYSKELVSSGNITVTVQSSSFPVFVTGAVQGPGKITSDHPITVLEAIMEAGGFDYNKANLKAVRVIRTEDGKTRNYTVNLKGVINGSPIEIFYLQPSDIVFVPSKITWF